MAHDVSLPEVLGLIYLVSEVAVRFARRSGRGAKAADAGSLALLWVAIGLGIGLGSTATNLIQQAAFPLSRIGREAVMAVFASGLALRWWSILALGSFFTVDVAIAADHRLIRRGPYHLMRHPSYTGMMLAFVALALAFQNWIALAGVLLPIAAALAYRIRIEEAALLGAFGDEYRQYARSTRRLVPGVF